MSSKRATDTLLAPADVAVVGSGPVGLKVALDLADAGLKVLLIESGLTGVTTSAQALSDALVVNGKTHAPMSLAVQRAFGGTSNLWGGRAVPLDEIDFSERPFAPLARWPIPYS